ncbi:MAG: hypothetical protein KF820_03500 [Candidatus Paracaedibacteraceae bacterium]|nr:hypothetical protein [Candidatus Paracaedibacteraceae bacterium]
MNKNILSLFVAIIFCGSVFSADDMISPYHGVVKKLKLDVSQEEIPPLLLDNPESLSLATLRVFVEKSKFDARYKPTYDAEKNNGKGYSYYTSPITSNNDKCFYLYAARRLNAKLADVVSSGSVAILYMGYQKTESSAILKYQLISTVDVNGTQQAPFPYNFTIEYIQKKLVTELTPQQQERRSLLRKQRTLNHIRLGTNDVPQKLGSDIASSSTVASSSSSDEIVEIGTEPKKKKKKHRRERSASVNDTLN